MSVFTVKNKEIVKISWKYTFEIIVSPLGKIMKFSENIVDAVSKHSTN